MKYLPIIFFITYLNFGFSQTSNKGGYSFFIAGHTYGSPGTDNIGLHPPFKQKFNYIKGREDMKFGFLLGDIVLTSTVKNWEEVDVDVDSLGMPVYFAFGNHDMDKPAVVKERYDSTYYSFYYENDLFIVLDPNIDGWNISNDQFKFLDSVVSNCSSEVKNIFVMSHQVLWSVGEPKYNKVKLNSYEGMSETINFWNEVIPVFEKKESNIFFCTGDVGAAAWSSDFAFDVIGKYAFIATGMGEGIGDNFIIIKVSDDKKVDFDLICLNDENINCFGTLESHVITSIKENDFQSLNYCYPNPFNQVLNIEGYKSYQLFNLDGAQVSFGNIIDQKIVFSGLKEGVFVLKVKNDIKEEIIKIVKTVR